ncbi:MAG: hypothetical protein KA327_05290 [Pseudarcicella sp.]|nr:hypothetical protein [Pseudarcicella sp.]
MSREQIVVSMRPNLELAEANTAIEQFQNSTLRPILKLQNQLLLSFFQDKIIQSNSRFENLSSSEKQITLANIYQKDLAFRQQNIGLILGMFTSHEFDFFLQNKQEVAKRIITMIMERVKSQV